MQRLSQGMGPFSKLVNTRGGADLGVCRGKSRGDLIYSVSDRLSFRGLGGDGDRDVQRDLQT